MGVQGALSWGWGGDSKGYPGSHGTRVDVTKAPLGFWHYATSLPILGWITSPVERSHEGITRVHLIPWTGLWARVSSSGKWTQPKGVLASIPGPGRECRGPHQGLGRQV